MVVLFHNHRLVFLLLLLLILKWRNFLWQGKVANDVFMSYLNTCPNQGSRTIRTEVCATWELCKVRGMIFVLVTELSIIFRRHFSYPSSTSKTPSDEQDSKSEGCIQTFADPTPHLGKGSCMVARELEWRLWSLLTGSHNPSLGIRGINIPVERLSAVENILTLPVGPCSDRKLIGKLFCWFY